jgi:NADPH-dependent curcumin reductase CurA
MHQRANRLVRLKSRPSGVPEAEHFEIVEAPVPDLSDGRVLVRNIYLSVDPAMRGWVSAVANMPSLWRLVRSCARLRSGVWKSREIPSSIQATT